MENFVITSDVPVPTAQRIRQRGAFALTCDMLEVGQSFFAPGKSIKGIYASISPKRFPGKKFRPAAIAAVGDTPAGVRVWRVA